MSEWKKKVTARFWAFALQTCSGVILLGLTYILSKKLIAPSVPPGKKDHLKKILAKLGRTASLSLNVYEEIVAQQLIDPDSIDVTFQDIGGQDHLIQEILRSTSLFFIKCISICFFIFCIAFTS